MFTDCHTLEELKTEYKRLIFAAHPDRRPEAEREQATRETQDINAAYAQALADFARNDQRRRQEEAHAQGRKSAADFRDIDELAEILRAVIVELLKIPGIEIELCGLWLWVTGDTKPHKEELKALKLKWSHDKRAWYFAGVPSYNRTRWTLEHIREAYGSQKFDRAEESEPAQNYQSLHA